MVEESDIKYDEVARKLAMVEGDLMRAEERAEAGESKIVDLEEELRVIGENLKALEVAEEKAQQREEEYKKQVRFSKYTIFFKVSATYHMRDIVFYFLSLRFTIYQVENKFLKYGK